MDGGKPLIFIKPYTKTLQKLKEVLEESSEQQGTEIYEIEDLQEAIQLIPQIEQSLVIAAHPRKTAMLLQASRQHIKKLQSKVLLISPKPIPRKTVDKFMKVGLTECIVEPIVPKTLQYKVNLLIRSMAQKKEETNFEKKFDSDVVEQDSDFEVKEMQRKHKEVLEEALEEAKKEHKEVDFDDDLYGKKKTFKENPIEGFYKGKTHKKETSKDENADEKKSLNSDNLIEGFYKGKLGTQETTKDKKPDKKNPNLNTDDDVQKLAKKVNLLFDEEDTGKVESTNDDSSKKKIEKKKPDSLEIDDEINTNTIEEDIEKDNSLDDVASHHLDLINDLSDKPNKKDAQEEEPEQGKKKVSLDITQEAEFKEKQDIENDVEIAKLKRSNPLEVEQDEEAQSEEKHSNEAVPKEGKKKVNLELEEEELDEDASLEDMLKQLKKASQSAHLQLEDDEEIEEEVESLSDDESESKKDKVSLEIEPDQKEKNNESDDLCEEEQNSRKKVLLEIEEEGLYTKNPATRKNKKERNTTSKSNELDIEDDSRPNDRQRHQEKDYARGSSGFTEHIQEREGNKADAHSDKIQTHYDSRRSTTHGEDEWDGFEREQQFDDQWKRAKKNEFIMPEKAAFGEQTIDYSDLKKQFDAIEYDLSGKKNVGEFSDQEAGAKPLGFASAISSTIEEVSSEEIDTQDEVEESTEGPIQEASIKCGPTLVRSLGLYLVQNNDRAQVLNGILELLRDDMNVYVAIKYGSGPHDGKVKLEMIDEWMEPEEKILLLNSRQNSKDCPILPSYSDKTFEKKKTTFFYPYTEGITTFAWAECYLPMGTSEENLKGIETVLESARGVLLDEFYELGGSGPYAKIVKTKDEKKESAVKGFFGRMFGKKKAA